MFRNNKLTIEFVKESFEKEGYKLLTEKYRDNKQKLRYICPKGHERSIKWNDWQQGHRCSSCYGNVRLTIKFIKSEFVKEDYILLTTVYKNSQQKLDYICPKGHKHSINWANWQQGHRCPYCDGNAKLTIEFIRSEFKKEGYKLLTKVYENARQKLRHVCPNGHKHSICWSDWQQGHRCGYCVGQGKPTIGYIKFEFEKENYELLTKEYINNKQKLEYVCPKGHEGSIMWNNWISGYRCLCCANQSSINVEFIRSEFDKEDYQLLTKKYINNRQKLDYICSRGHRYNISWNSWQQGQRCSKCMGIVSKGEIEVREFVGSLGIKVLSNNRGQIFNPETGYGFELDIFMPILNKAIEYNGEYWHQDKSRDLLKQQLCKLKNIDLLTVWDNEWKKYPNLCKNEIKTFIFHNERDGCD